MGAFGHPRHTFTALEVLEMMAFRLDTDLVLALARVLLSLPRLAAARMTCGGNARGTQAGPLQP